MVTFAKLGIFHVQLFLHGGPHQLILDNKLSLFLYFFSQNGTAADATIVFHVITCNCSNQALFTLFIAVFGLEISEEVRLLSCSADKVGYEPVLHVVLGSNISKWLLINHYFMDNVDLIGG